MKTVQLDLLFTILAAMVVLFAGRALDRAVGVLETLQHSGAGGWRRARRHPPGARRWSGRRARLVRDEPPRQPAADVLHHGRLVRGCADAGQGRTEAGHLPARQRRVHRRAEHRRHRGGDGDGSPPDRGPARRIDHADRRSRHRRRVWRPPGRDDERRRRDGTDDGVRDGRTGARERPRRTARGVPGEAPRALARSCRERRSHRRRRGRRRYDHDAVGAERAVRDHLLRLPPANISPASFWGPDSSCRTFSSACCSES